MKDCFIGIDAGTSVTKVCVFDAGGAMLARSARRTQVRSPQPGFREVDPASLWQAVCDGLREVTGIVPAERIAALGLSAAMVGAYVLDGEGRPVRPGITWDDGRTQAMIDPRLRDEPDFLSRIFAVSGSVMQTGCTLPLLAWLLANESDVMASARTVFGAKDFLGFCLTGVRATDISEAAVAPGDARAQARSKAMLDLFGLSPHAHLLPDPVPSGTLLGGVNQAAAQAAGLPAGTPVVLGAGDVVASLVGADAARPGTATTILGTTCLSGLVLDRPLFEPRDVGLLFSLPGPAWYRAMVNVAGTTNIDWMVRTLTPDLAGSPTLYADLESLAAASPPGARGVLYHPYLSDLGIIAPVVSTAARGRFSGLTTDVTRADLVRAVYEGVAFAIRDCYAALAQRPDVLNLTGGGARSPFWSQLIASITGIPVALPAGEEFGALGAARLARKAVTGDAGPVLPPIRRHEPQPQAGAVFDEAFARFRQVRDEMLDGPAA